MYSYLKSLILNFKSNNKVASRWRKLFRGGSILLPKVLPLQKLPKVSLFLVLLFIYPPVTLAGNNEEIQEIQTTLQERQILENSQNSIQLGKELSQLRQIPPSERTPAQQQRLVELINIERSLLENFNNFINTPEVQALIAHNKTSTGENIDLEKLKYLQDNLQQLEQKAVLFYPLILDDRLELIIVTPYAPPIRHTVKVSRKELDSIIVSFRQALQNPTSDVRIPAKKLYDWLIAPIETELTQADAQMVLYAPDGALRYIPLAALYDGRQWLVERFGINNITSSSLIDFDRSSQQELRVLAAAFTENVYDVQIGNDKVTFSPLAYAQKEVEKIATFIPDTGILLGRNFTLKALLTGIQDHNIIHLATNAVFSANSPEDSFILFGDGTLVTLNEIENWNLSNVDFIVLSACDTGLGANLGDGREILGFGYIMQQAGAKAVIASLWAISDDSTSVFMDAFYQALVNDKTTKTGALRQAQIALIKGNEQQTKGISIKKSLNGQNRLSHPYYWASFILIGNGL